MFFSRYIFATVHYTGQSQANIWPNSEDFSQQGTGVIKARQLYRLVYPTAIFDDIDIYCDTYRSIEEPEPFLRKADSNNEILIRPNPAIDVLTIECLSECKLPMHLTMKSINNSKVIEKRLDNHISTVEISNLPQGFYFCTISTNDNKVESFKIVIMRN